MQEICKQKKLHNEVEVLGWVEEDAGNNLFSISDILILPPYFESFELVDIEALAHKIPVICGNKGLIRNILRASYLDMGNII